MPGDAGGRRPVPCSLQDSQRWAPRTWTSCGCCHQASSEGDSSPGAQGLGWGSQQGPCPAPCAARPGRTLLQPQVLAAGLGGNAGALLPAARPRRITELTELPAAFYRSCLAAKPKKLPPPCRVALFTRIPLAWPLSASINIFASCLLQARARRDPGVAGSRQLAGARGSL